MKRVQMILDEAKEILGGDRREAYGPPEESFERIAEFWSAYKEVAFSAKDVAMMMLLLKVAREKNAHKHDNLVDMCGYAALTAALVREQNDGTTSQVSSDGSNDQVISAKSGSIMGNSGPTGTCYSCMYYDTERSFCTRTDFHVEPKHITLDCIYHKS